VARTPVFLYRSRRRNSAGSARDSMVSPLKKSPR
jgi:hypothetical protein